MVVRGKKVKECYKFIVISVVYGLCWVYLIFIHPLRMSEVLLWPLVFNYTHSILFTLNASISRVVAVFTAQPWNVECQNHVMVLSDPQSVLLTHRAYVGCGASLWFLLFSSTWKVSIPNSNHIFSNFLPTSAGFLPMLECFSLEMSSLWFIL
jgi:hypothetical protein